MVKEKKIARAAAPAALSEGWRRVKFGDVVRDVKVTADPETSGLERYVAGEHMNTDDLHIRSWGTIGDGYLGPAFHRKFVKGQILYGSRRTYLRKVAVADFDGVCANTTFVLEPKDDELLPELLPFVMQTDSFNTHAVKQSRGSVNPYVNFRDIAWYEFALPPKNEQRRIAEILWSADETENNYRLVLDELNTLKEAASFRFFRPSSSRIQITTCAELCEEITVGIVVTPAKYYVSTGVPALRSLNVFPDRLSLDELVHISADAHIQHSKSVLKKGDVVIVRSGRPGDAVVIPEELDNTNCIDLIIARPGPSLRPEFLSRFLNSIAGRKQLNRGTAGTAQQHFNVGALKKVYLPVVSLDEQDRIVAELNVIDSTIDSISRQVEAVKQLRKALTNQLLTFE